MTEGPITVDKMHVVISLDDGTTYAAAACQTDLQYNPSSDTIEQDCKDTGGGAKHIKGKFRWTLSGSADFAFDSPLGYKQLHDAMALGDGKLLIKVTTGSSTAGDYTIDGEVLLNSLPLSSSGGSNGLVNYNFDSVGQGIPTISVIV